jgi:hypothetical protein
VSRKAHREGWLRDPKHIKTRPEQPKPMLPVVPIPDMAHRADEPAPAKRAGKPVTTRTVHPRECRWIPGEATGDAPMCAHPTVFGSSWCAYHYERCYA